MAPQPLASSRPLFHPWSVLDGSGPRRCWCIGNTEQHCLPRGSTPAGWSIPGASDTYTMHRSISPICDTKATSHQPKATVFNSITNKPRYSFTLGAGRPSLKACIRSSLQTKLLSARLNNSFILCWISDFSKLSRCILVGSWLPAYSYAECTLLWQGITHRARKFPTTHGPSWRDQSIRPINADT